MKGRNELHLCESQMREIIAHWLDDTLKYGVPRPSVKRVLYYADSNTFTVMLDGAMDPTGAV